MRNFKVIVKNAKKGKALLLSLFEKGGRWPDGSKTILNVDSYGFVGVGGIIYRYDEKNHESIPEPELTYDEAMEIKTEFVEFNEENVFFIEKDGVRINGNLLPYEILEKVLAKRTELFGETLVEGK